MVEIITLKLIIGWWFGTTMEVMSSGFHDILDAKTWKEKIAAMGDAPMVLKPVYAVMFGLVFPELMKLLSGLPDWIRFFWYANIFICVEYLLGLFFDRVIGVKIWDYSKYQDVIGNGYTRVSLWSMWGFCALILESLHNYIGGLV